MDLADAAVAVQRRTTQKIPVLFIMRFYFIWQLTLSFSEGPNQPKVGYSSLLTILQLSKGEKINM
jgi:hypothetical protein